MSGGYDNFFKQAQRAKGLVDSSNGPKVKFKLKPQDEVREPKKQPQNQKQNQQQLKRTSSMSPEDRLRLELAHRIRMKKRAALKKKKMPLYPVVVASFACIACALGYQYSDHVDQWLAKIEIGIFGSAQAAGENASAAKPASAGPAKSTQDSRETKAKTAEAKDTSSATAEASNKQWSNEEISYFSKLNERKKELDLREAELAKLEEELQRRKEELDQKIKALESMRGEISKTLETRVAEDQARVDKLVQVYSGMKPAQAAKVIETLNEDLAVEVLDKMKKKSASEILDMMDAKKARRLSELMTGYRRSTASEEASVVPGTAPRTTEEGN